MRTLESRTASEGRSTRLKRTFALETLSARSWTDVFCKSPRRSVVTRARASQPRTVTAAGGGEGWSQGERSGLKGTVRTVGRALELPVLRPDHPLLLHLALVVVLLLRVLISLISLPSPVRRVLLVFTILSIQVILIRSVVVVPSASLALDVARRRTTHVLLVCSGRAGRGVCASGHSACV